jgi:hypothetical protein
VRACVAALALAALAGCASQSKVPLAPGEKLLSDRIDALEADLAQLHAEMQELRVDYVPIEEMSEAEFERHLEKKLAAAPPETKPALEKELRAKRKSSTLKGKALAGYWEERFNAEVPDEAWAKQAEATCRGRVEAAVKPAGKLFAIECRKERCRVELEAGADGPQADAAINACTSDPAELELFSGSEAVSRVTGSNGRVRAIVYVARKGYSMKVE